MPINNFKQSLKFNIDNTYLLKKQLESGAIKTQNLTSTELEHLNNIYDEEIKIKMRKLFSLLS